jgi:hypothetical protein
MIENVLHSTGIKRWQRLVAWFLPGLFIAGSAAPAPAADLRQSVNFNREWKFQLGDVPAADAAAFDDAKWDGANLPHSFSMPYFAADRFYVGYGWYRNISTCRGVVGQARQSGIRRRVSSGGGLCQRQARGRTQGRLHRIHLSTSPTR